jgi:hypothetical protein
MERRGGEGGEKKYFVNEEIIFYFVFQSTFQTTMIMIAQNKRLGIILLGVAILLLIPLIAMQFSSEVNWSGMDFLIMGGLLFGLGLAGDFVWRKVKSKDRRILYIVGIVVLFLLIWAELAVGIFGTPLAGS